MLPKKGDFIILNNSNDYCTSERITITKSVIEPHSETPDSVNYEFQHCFFSNGAWIKVGKSSIKLEKIKNSKSEEYNTYYGHTYIFGERLNITTCSKGLYTLYRPSTRYNETWERERDILLDDFFRYFWRHVNIPQSR